VGVAVRPHGRRTEMSFRFRVHLADGEHLDDYSSSEPNWKPGDVLYAGGKPAYRITRIVSRGEIEGSVYDGIFEVEALQPAVRAIPDRS
jgi:hypothetical protein